MEKHMTDAQPDSADSGLDPAGSPASSAGLQSTTEASPTPENEPTFNAIVLAGGGGRRLGGVSKSDLQIQGKRFLDQIISTLRAEGVPDERIVVVGPDSVDVPEGIALTFEDPPKGGPGAGIVAGLAALGYQPGDEPTGDLALVTTCDAPFSAFARQALAKAVSAPDVDVAAVRDRSGVLQQLLAVYKVDPLLKAIEDAPATHNRAVKKLVAGLRFEPVEVEERAEIDVDTWEDFERLKRVVREN